MLAARAPTMSARSDAVEPTLAAASRRGKRVPPSFSLEEGQSYAHQAVASRFGVTKAIQTDSMENYAILESNSTQPL